ncbi:hypothetical protein MLD38_013920 [Melastoma candidum]|uniref:Uncharacterized protein n=1 Tax=Melastoma candidum TaxID=119954 RepID=A0ACB9RET4_9MYRT|nr:hypothetical protein MLD38_013920 [Melastoma candidum]
MLAALAIAVLLAASPATTASCPKPPSLPSGSLLTFLGKVQSAALRTLGPSQFDPKLYVDLPLRYALPTVERAFDDLSRNGTANVTKGKLEGFLGKYFEAAGDDLVEYVPPDYFDVPEGFLPKVVDGVVREWALEVHSLWKKLSRRVSGSVAARPDLHTLISLPEPVIIPGSRFREVYYWDSYWVIRGLLASKMYHTAKSVASNLIYILDTYGHVLNGARVYYINRSQPPLLSAMVYAIYERTLDKEFVKEALPALMREHGFWTSGLHQITVQDNQGNHHNLSRYYAMWNKPRPESSTIDEESASNITIRSEQHHFYREVASTAESGWDFSTRWMRVPGNITTLSTTSVLPVDLNTYILRTELDISFLAEAVGNYSIAHRFLEASKARKTAIDAILWNEKKGQWLDYWLTKITCKDGQFWAQGNPGQGIVASNFVPLWINLFNSDKNLVERVVKSFQSSGLIGPFGIATSRTNSGQQWDFPNGWAPLQHMIVEGLTRSTSIKARILAKEIAVSWIRTNHVAYKKTGAMHEKYIVDKCGEFGGGGEYVPQTGFGWSNGVVLAFLEEFGWQENQTIDCRWSKMGLNSDELQPR